MNDQLSIAVTGMHRGENPQPGPSIVAAIRQCWPDAMITGLVYNAYESGIYVSGGPDRCHTMPYPTVGAKVWLNCLREVKAQTPFDLLIPTLDTEVLMLAGCEEELQAMGVTVLLPTVESLARTGKAHLSDLASECGVGVPATMVARDAREAVAHADSLGYPLFVKGCYYDAAMIRSAVDLTYKAAELLADWGPPIMLQEPVVGTEFNVLGLGDGKGGLMGSCAVRKLIISDKGKGNGSIIIRDARLDEITRRLVEATCWRGPFEFEFIRDARDDRYLLIEINPRFPAWVGFPAELGANFPAAWVQYMMNGSLPVMPTIAPGKFFVRHQIEVCGDVTLLTSLLDDVAGSCEASKLTNMKSS